MPTYRRYDLDVEAYQLPVDPSEDDNQAFHAWADKVGLEWSSERHGVVAFRTLTDPDDPEFVNGAGGGDWIAKYDGKFFSRSDEQFSAMYSLAPSA